MPPGTHGGPVLGAALEPKTSIQTATPGFDSTALARSASATGLSPILLKVPSQRGADASNVANAACTAITTPTEATNRRDPVTLPSSAPQKIFSRALTR